MRRRRAVRPGSEACHDAPVRARRASSQLRSQRQRGAAQPRLRLRHEGARQPEARLGRSVLLPPPRGRGHPHRPEARRRHHRRRRCCTTSSRTRTSRAPRSTRSSARRSAPSSTGLTKISRLDLVTKKAEQAENFRKLLVAISSDIRVLLIKLADRLHNMRTLEHMKPESRRRISEETLEIYAPLAGRMGMQTMREELEELAFRWLHPEAYADRHRQARRDAQDRTRAWWRRSAPR